MTKDSITTQTKCSLARAITTYPNEGATSSTHLVKNRKIKAMLAKPSPAQVTIKPNQCSIRTFRR